jgi:hypothetical protein
MHDNVFDTGYGDCFFPHSMWSGIYAYDPDRCGLEEPVIKVGASKPDQLNREIR